MPETLPRLHNPNLTDDEVRFIAIMLDGHKAKLQGDLQGLINLAVSILVMQERAGGEEFFDRLNAKFNKLWDIVGCNCDDPDCEVKR